MNKRTIIILVLILVTAVALPLAVYLVQQQQELRSRAAPATTLCFATGTTCATTISATVDRELIIDVLMTTGTNQGTNQVTAAELFVPFSDASLFQTSPAPTIREITGGSLPTRLVQGAFSGNTFTITVGAQPGSPATGSNIPIARVTLTPSRNGSTKISFGGATRIAGIQEGSNVLSSSQDATITVTGGAAPTAPPGPAAPTATPTPTATPAPTAGPTPTPTPGPGACTDTKPAGSPTLTSVTAGTNSATLVWTAALDPVTHYGVVYGLAPGEERFGALNIGNKNIRTFTVNNLAGGTTYYFRVKAFNGCAQGNPSNEVSATPTGGQVTGPGTQFVLLPTATPTAIPVVIATPTPTQVVGKGGQPIPEAGNVTPTTIFLSVGAFLLLLGGVLLFL